MFYYLPEYNEKTALKGGVLANMADVIARSNLIREMGGQVAGERWKKNNGYVPMYEFPRKLTVDEMEILCLAPN